MLESSGRRGEMFYLAIEPYDEELEVGWIEGDCEPL